MVFIRITPPQFIVDEDGNVVQVGLGLTTGCLGEEESQILTVTREPESDEAPASDGGPEDDAG